MTKQAGEQAKGSDDDPEFNEKHRHLELFLEIQEPLLTSCQGGLLFTDEMQRFRYFHFVLGAIDQLSRTIKDKGRSELWAMGTSIGRELALFSEGDAEKYTGTKYIDSYGRTDYPELYSAGKRGWYAMRTYILYAVGKVTKGEFLKSCTELSYVVRGTGPNDAL